jgi:hypothetical protein
MASKKPSKPFRSAKAEVKNLTEQGLEAIASPAYELAFMDEDFLLRKELRPVRLMLELLKPEIIQREEHIESTVVIFGSARLPEKKIAKARLAKIHQRLKASPNNIELQEAAKLAENMLAKSIYYDEARKLARIISKACQKDKKRHFVIVTGGGPGIMEAANRGANDVAAKSLGLNIVLPMEQAPNPYISPELCFQFHYFAMRKMHFLIRARALVAFPGGYGTLDELFEALTLLQTGKIKRMPVLLFGQEYWSKIVNFQKMAEEGMIAPEDLQLFQFVEKAEDAWQIISHFYEIYENKQTEDI